MSLTDFFDIGATFIEAQMVDTCVIRRDLPGVKNDVLDEDTGELVRQPDDGSLVYSGKCLMKAVSAKDMNYAEGDLAVFRKVYNVFIPKSAPQIELGDTYIVVASLLDDTLIDQEFRVMEVRFSTHSTYRFLRVEDVQQDYGHTNPNV